jgi:hypothetical protein
MFQQSRDFQRLLPEKAGATSTCCGNITPPFQLTLLSNRGGSILNRTTARRVLVDDNTPEATHPSIANPTTLSAAGDADAARRGQRTGECDSKKRPERLAPALEVAFAGGT